MEYFNIFFIDFLGRQVSLKISQNIFICVPKTNEGLTGLIQHGGE